MGKIRSTQQPIKIDGKLSEYQGCFSAQYPWFSFKDVTKNSKYNLDTLSTGTEKEKTLNGLFDKLNKLSEKPWIYWMQNRKQSGLETLSYNDLNFKAGPDAEISKDTTVYIFRFDTYKGSDKGRVIGYKKTPCAVLHIIGYDLDFSAYNHG